MKIRNTKIEKKLFRDGYLNTKDEKIENKDSDLPSLINNADVPKKKKRKFKRKQTQLNSKKQKRKQHKDSLEAENKKYKKYEHENKDFKNDKYDNKESRKGASDIVEDIGDKRIKENIIEKENNEHINFDIFAKFFRKFQFAK